MPKFTVLQVIHQQDKVRDGHYAIDNKDLAKNRNVKVRIQIKRGPKRVVLYRKWSNVERKSSHNDYRGTGGWFSQWKC
jgi:hypothetical protein